MGGWRLGIGIETPPPCNLTPLPDFSVSIYRTPHRLRVKLPRIIVQDSSIFCSGRNIWQNLVSHPVWKAVYLMPRSSGRGVSDYEKGY
ncbi:hypothetical protein ACN38_g13122 [Penicillium nordicum]|uniref:Uncharacterized protein n=1 Tax=Penicillium nordicum TaxID=229535 RepID=A0A0M8NNK9_9EURO|nr:hypothetical protein ACN38_g13122 [Penicillium nordicum]